MLNNSLLSVIQIAVGKKKIHVVLSLGTGRLCHGGVADLARHVGVSAPRSVHRHRGPQPAACTADLPTHATRHTKHPGRPGDRQGNSYLDALPP